MNRVFTVCFLLICSPWGLAQKGVYKSNITLPPEVIRAAPKDSVLELPIILGDITLKLGSFGRAKLISKQEDGSVKLKRGSWTIDGSIIHIDLGVTSDLMFDAEYISYDSGIYLNPIENSCLYLKRQ